MTRIFKCAECGAVNSPDLLVPGQQFVCPNCGKPSYLRVEGEIELDKPEQLIPKGPLGPRTLSEIFTDTFKVLRSCDSSVILASIFLSLLEMLCFFVPFSWLFGLMPAMPEPGQHVPIITPPDFPKNFFLVMFVSMGIFFIIDILHRSAWYHIVSRTLLGRPIETGTCFAISLRRIAVGILSTLLAGLGCVVLFFTIIGIPFVYYFGLSFQFIVGFEVLARTGPIASIKRSVGLIRGTWWRVFGITFVLGLVVQVLIIPLMFLGPVLVVTKTYWPILAYLAIVFPAIQMYLSVSHVLLFLDLRVRK